MAKITVKLYGASVVQPPRKEDIVADLFCKCLFISDWEELAFAYNGENGDLDNKKDYSDFLLSKVSASDTIEFELYRYGLKVADLNDDTYGTFYDGFTAQPNYSGFVVDWTKVFNAFTGGQYQVQAKTNILGVEDTFRSRLFRVNLYDELSAKKTVKIESWQTGNVVSSIFDYTDLLPDGWYSSIRLQGEFGKASPELVEDKFLDSSYRQTQRREETKFTYTLSGWGIPENIYKTIAENQALANTMQITSYDVWAEQKYLRKPVAVSSFANNNYRGTGRVDFDIELTDRVQNTFKRNY